jgi:hypothetical protein
MDVIKYIYSELCYFIKSSFDITMHKIASIIHRDNSGL